MNHKKAQILTVGNGALKHDSNIRIVRKKTQNLSGLADWLQGSDSHHIRPEIVL